MRFLVDMPLSPALAVWLRSAGHNAVHATDVNLARAPDTAIMARAKTELRTVVTADLDYPQLLAISRATDPSVILFRDGDWSDTDVIRRMTDVLAALSPADIINSIVVVEKNRIRRR